MRSYPERGYSIRNSNLSASLSELQGDVGLKNPGQADFNVAQTGNRLEVQGQVRTGTDGRVRLDLSTGTIVRVASNSLFVLESNQQQETSLLTHLKLEAGRLWVILRGGQLEIEMPSDLASVRGSYMSVWVDPETQDVWVTCLEGWCQAKNSTAALDLIAGQEATLYSWNPASTIPPPPPQLRYLTKADIDEFVANNPEWQDVLNEIIATASALPTFTPTFTFTSSPTATFTPIPTATFTPILTETPTPTPEGCVNLLSPSDGADFPDPVKVDFTWTEYPAAYQYVLTFQAPSGSRIGFDSSIPNIVRYIEAFPEGGTYQWWVTVKNGDLADICTSRTFTFTKPETIPPTPTSTPAGGGNNGQFWNRSGPTGPRKSCEVLKFSVTTSLTGLIKVIYSTTNDKPNGDDPHIVIGNGPGTGSGTLTGFSCYTGEVYWRFAVYDDAGVYHYDGKVFKFSCKYVSSSADTQPR